VEEPLMLARWSKLRNWGDALNPVLIKLIAGEDPQWVATPPHRRWFRRRFNEPVYVVVGSTLRYAVDEDTVIWGAGFRAIDDTMHHKPARVCAVRGPLTRMKLLAMGVECPDVYGDPALLYPRFYRPGGSKRYELGIIPHFTDKDLPAVKRLASEPGVKLIDIEGPTNRVVDDICCCQRVASSSLHGIIVADAYGVESSWVEFSANVIGSGFKFADYFMAVGRPWRNPILADDATGRLDIEKAFRPYELTIDLDLLWETCPFRRSGLPDAQDTSGTNGSPVKRDTAYASDSTRAGRSRNPA
jgi:pyruvyltransferase